MYSRISPIVSNPWLWHLSRLLLVAMFIASALAKLIDFPAGTEEMRTAGLEPAWLYNCAVILTLLTGSALVLLNRALWLGAGILSVFLLLTIIIVHRFWALPDPQAQLAMFFAIEHLAVIGGLIAASIAAHYRRPHCSCNRCGCQ